MLWTVDLPSAEVRVRLAAERVASSPFSLLTRTEAVEKSLVKALGFDVDGIARREGLHYVKVRKTASRASLCVANDGSGSEEIP